MSRLHLGCDSQLADSPAAGAGDLGADMGAPEA